MYKYFAELDNPDQFKLYVKRGSSLEAKPVHIKNVQLSNSFFEQTKDLWKRIPIIDLLIKTFDLKLAKLTLKPDEMMEIFDFFGYFHEDEDSTQNFENKLDLDSFELEILLRKYYKYSFYLTSMYPDKKEFLDDTKIVIQNMLNELNKINLITFPLLNENIMLNWANGWYITPSGYLYNTGTGHAEGNLWSSVQNIYCCLENNMNIPNLSLRDAINLILDRGYISSGDFSNYAHLSVELPTISTKETEDDKIRLDAFMETFSVNEYCKLDEKIMPNPKRSYQKNMITLIVGYMAAKTDLYQACRKFNSSSQKEKIFEDLISINKGCL